MASQKIGKGFRKHLLFSAGDASDVILDVEDFPPGEYNLTVRVEDENGRIRISEVESLSLSGRFVCDYVSCC